MANRQSSMYVYGDSGFEIWFVTSATCFLGVGWDWVHLVRRPLIGLLYQPRMIDDDECGAVGGMRIVRGDRNTRRKPAPVPLCPPQIPHHLTWTWTRTVAVGSRRLTAWATARPHRLPGWGFSWGSTDPTGKMWDSNSIRSRPLPIKTLWIHHSPITLPFGDLQFRHWQPH
jgi:hypothetical protein